MFLGLIFAQMARLHSIKELAEQLGVEVSDCVVSCFYCKRWLTYPDKILFMNAQLGLYYKDGQYFGACQPCVRVTARLDFVANYQKFISVQELIGQNSITDFLQSHVRCWACLKVLTLQEKSDVVTSGEDIALIRDQIRAKCTLCKIGLL